MMISNISYELDTPRTGFKKIKKSNNSGLRFLTSISSKLKHSDIPNATVGFDGLNIAHEILQKQNSVGVLIGSLSEALWNQKRTKDDLYLYKDVNVAVLDNKFNVSSFYGGIDWWYKQRECYPHSENSYFELWKNAFGNVLSFGIRKNSNLKSGLYILDSDAIVKMREYEVFANLQKDENIHNLTNFDFERYSEYIRRRVKFGMPMFIREKFNDYILSERYCSDKTKNAAVELVRFNPYALTVIHGLKQTECLGTNIEVGYN